LLRAVLDYQITHASRANAITLSKAIEDGFIYATSYGNLTITKEGRERLGELEDK